jgi:hypothetical protein
MLLSIMHTPKHLPGDSNRWAGASLFDTFYVSDGFTSFELISGRNAMNFAGPLVLAQA